MSSLFSYQLGRCGQDIILEDRETRFKNGDPVATFSGADTINAIVKTVSGVRVFDDTNTEVDITHEICIPYQAGVTSEKWVKLGSRRIRVITVENCCEKDEVLKLRCTERGPDVKEANNA